MWGSGCIEDDKKLGDEAGEKHLDKGLVELKNESWKKDYQAHERKEISSFNVEQTFWKKLFK